MNPSGAAAEVFVLAGGRASRFGSDKNLAAYQGSPLVSRALDAARKLGRTPRLVCRDPEPYFRLGVPFVLKERPGKGPLEGVRAALESAATPWCLILAGDMPGVTGALLENLLSEAEAADRPANPLVCFRENNERWHPFPGAYHRSLLPRILELEEGASMHRLLETTSPRALEIPEESASRMLRNVNRPSDIPHS